MSEQEVLVPVDGSPQSDDALEHALATFDDADITALTAVDPIAAGYAAAPGPDATGYPGEWTEQAEERADTVLDEAADLAEEHDVDQVVIGSHGRTGVTRVLLGSVAENVVRRAPCPVTVVR